MSAPTDKRVRNHLQAILDATTDLLVAVGIPDTAAELVNGERIRQIAFCECIRRTGEAVAQIDAIAPEFLGTQFPDIPWRDIKGSRNILTHHYWTVDYTILHTIATIHLPLVTAPIAEHLGERDPYG